MLSTSICSPYAVTLCVGIRHCHCQLFLVLPVHFGSVRSALCTGQHLNTCHCLLHSACPCWSFKLLAYFLQRKKTDMEDIFTAAIPQQQRGGSKFVFRQGNPLTAADLKLVAADGGHQSATMQSCHMCI
eukprot:GHRR01034394.1.p1 GENE.GHRR01034394.1~~GHRR01034394.1.p1  ORF type:complete len:129 (+),score=33.49 GHRR01034394.1:802-1188(+)